MCGTPCFYFEKIVVLYYSAFMSHILSNKNEVMHLNDLQVLFNFLYIYINKTGPKHCCSFSIISFLYLIRW